MVRWLKKILSIFLAAIKRALRREHYYLDEDQNLHLVKRLHLKWSFASIAVLAIGATLLYFVNDLAGDLLHLGYGQIAGLKLENQALRDRVATLDTHVGELESSMNHLNAQGNELRLLVDLPKLDDATASAGTGGAAAEPLSDVSSENGTEHLQSAASTLQKMVAELKVQEQSYQQIERKYQYNKSYFAALPALKPMDGFYSAHDFGIRMHPVLGIMRTHEGIDIVNDVGTPVVAAADGVVEIAGHSGGGYGITLILSHGYGYQTLYAHLSKVLVQAGTHVVRGQIIAKSGRTGLVSGPHLHYEVRFNGICKNPADFFLDDLKPSEYRAQLAAH
ncbi:MAG TPA: M23 family metallopeptidase [Bacteroidota bacterium]|nr:M23 family metallopeptidase [Bacteroidota bacterium]